MHLVKHSRYKNARRRFFLDTLGGTLKEAHELGEARGEILKAG